jgi:hypothetical protein
MLGLRNIFLIGNNVVASSGNTLYTDNIYMSSGSTINGFPISGVTNPTLSQVLTNGNTTGTNDIVISTTQKIDSYGGLSSIEMDKVGTEGVFAIATNVTGDYSKLTLNQSSADATIEAANISGEFSLIQITPSYIQNVVSDSLNYQGNVEIEYNSGINSLNTTLQTTSLTGSSFGEIKLTTDLTLDETTILIRNESGNLITFNKGNGLNTISIIGELITIGDFPGVYKAIQTRTIQTLNATPVNGFVFTNIGDGSKSFKVRVIGTKVGLDKSYYGELKGFYNVQSAIPTQVSTVDLVEKSTFTTATSTLDISGSDIRVRLTGEAATTINWEVIIETNAIQ